jgi:hypothetical protein
LPSVSQALFAPRVIDFEQKRHDSKPSPRNPDVDENVDIGEVREVCTRISRVLDTI